MYIITIYYNLIFKTSKIINIFCILMKDIYIITIYKKININVSADIILYLGGRNILSCFDWNRY